MTTDIRSRLVRRMYEVLEQKTANLPDSIPITIDVGPLVDAVIDEMSGGSGVPLLPRYDPEVWAERSWTQPFIQEEVMNGAPVYSASVDALEDPPAVAFTASAGGVADITVNLPPDDAEEFLTSGLAALAAVRARIDEPSPRG